jgi:uncharacterized RDD family membrane protein YckC
MKTRKLTALITTVAIGALSLGAMTGFAQEVEPVENIEAVTAVDNHNADSPAIEENRDAEPEKQKGVRHEAMVVIGKDVVLKAGDSAETVVVIGGSAKILGNCDEAVVIGGSMEVEGAVRESTVVIGGLLKALPGSSIGGDVVGIGSGVEISEGAKVTRKAVEINFKALKLEWLKEWLVQCVMKMRPLAPQIGWVWAVAGIFTFIYLLMALAFPRPIQACVEQLTERPATTFLAGLAAKLFLPVLLVILVMTGIGILVIPFLLAALVLGFLVGKVAMLEYLGGKFGQFLGADKKPVLAFLIGTTLVAVLYVIPVAGLITFCVISLWGLGAVVTATLKACRRERPIKPKPATPPDNGTTTGVSSSQGTENCPPEGTVSGSTEPSVAQTILTPPVVPTALAFPRATFWERMGAAFLDVVIVCILGAFVGGPPLGFLVMLAYFAGMWAWKGTTIGGIVLKLQLVRYDGGRITFPVALVRGIAAAFSAVVLFLGFFWIAWDRDKQSWHDKIVGTVVVRLPYSTPLVCV